MKINEIEEFSKTKCKLIFEDFSSIVLYKKDLKRYSISKGVELSNTQLKLLMEEILPYRAKSRCMKLLQSKDYTEAEIRNKLRGDGYPEKVADIAVEYLYSFHYLDDKRYVEAYYSSRCVRKSKKQIILELQQKGINKELIVETLAGVCSDSPEEDELQCILKLLAKKKYNDCEADIKEREKVKAYLFRKGFQIDNINTCMRNFDWNNM